MQDDCSRIGVLCSACGVFVYAWDGTRYVAEHMLSNITATFVDFSVREDFKMITIIYWKTGVTATRQVTLMYNNALRGYSIGP